MRSIFQRWMALAGLTAAVAAPAAGLGGCGRADLGGAARDPAKSVEVAPDVVKLEAPVGAPVTDEECWAFAASIENAVHSANGAGFGALIDWDAILKTATAGIRVQEESRKGFIQGVKSSMKQDQGLVPQIVANVKGGGSYTFLRQRARDKHKTALFRLVMPDGNGENYHEFVLARRPDDTVRAVDIYIFLSGELISQTMRRMYIPVAAQTSGTLLDRLVGTEQLFMKNFPKFEQMTTAVRGGRPAEALKIYQQLPPELMKDKNILLVRLQAAQEVNDGEYARAIEDFRAAHPDDACIDMISIDYYLLKKDYPRAFACIDRLDQAVGGDPYLNVTRANIHTDEERYDDARRDARRAIAQDPTLQDAYWTLVTISLQEHSFAETATLLNQLEGRFHIAFGDMSQLPVFSEFVNSPEYRTWKERPKPDGKKTAPTPTPEPKTLRIERDRPAASP